MVSLREFLSTAGRRTLAATLACAALCASATAGAADATLIRIGFQKGTPLTLLKAQGNLDKELAGRGYKVSWTEFPAGPVLLEAINAGAIDIGYTGSPPPIFAQAAGSRIVYLAAEPSGPHNEALIVHAHSPLKSVGDLKGHTVAVTKGSSSHYLLLAALEKAGLKLSDIKPVYLIPADARAAFETGNVDAWAIWDPYLVVVQQSTPTRTLADYASGIEQPYGYFLGSPDFAKNHQEVIKLIFDKVAQNDIWVSQHKDDSARLIAAETGIPQPVVKVLLDRSKFGLLPLDPAILASQQRVADLFYEAKVIPHAVRVTEIVYPPENSH